MALKGNLRKLAEQLTGRHIVRSQYRGVNVFKDIKTVMPDYRLETVFDVGANIGQSANIYLALSPPVRIYCFEPVTKAFAQLVANTRHSTRVHCFKLALSAHSGSGTMQARGISTMNRLLDEVGPARGDGAMPVEPVEITTLDEFCASERVVHIGYLKIDTEGNDLEVLKGAERMLARHDIDLVQVEAGMNPTNHNHVPFFVLKDFLENLHYFIFGIYEQQHEWPKNEPHLRCTNTVFISQPMIAAHARVRPARGATCTRSSDKTVCADFCGVKRRFRVDPPGIRITV